MVATQLRNRGIHDQAVLEAMGSIPRELFLDESDRARAYSDEPLPIGHGQTISQPYMTALMAQSLELNGSETVLEVGTGCGYHAAVLASIAAHVISLEIVPELAADACRNLARTGFESRVTVIACDGSVGHPARAPYEAISVAAAAPHIVKPLVDQLAEGGRLVIPVGSLDEQDLLVVTKSGGKTSSRFAARCRFVPLRGGQGWKLN